MLLGGLEDHVDRAVEVARLGQVLAAPSSIVVWPSWPQACITPGILAGVGLAGRLLDRQRVHVGPQADRLAGAAAADDADHAGLSPARS